MDEVKESIIVGLGKPKLYKRSVWNKAVKVMEFLSDNTTEIIRKNMGPGLEKYQSLVKVDEAKLNQWADAYKKSINK